MQEALKELQQQTKADFEYYDNDNAQKQLQLRNEILLRNEEQLREHVKAIEMMKLDIKASSKLDFEKVEFAISKEVEDQTKPLQSEIKDVIQTQITALDQHQKTIAEKISDITVTQTNDAQKMDQIKDMFNQHVSLMEALSKKCDAQSANIVENRKILQ